MSIDVFAEGEAHNGIEKKIRCLFGTDGVRTIANKG
jgi:hypothetical protein